MPVADSDEAGRQLNEAAIAAVCQGVSGFGRDLAGA